MPLPSIRPTFIVALGGTGTDIVRHLQTRLTLRYGSAEFPTLKYLFLDTDAAANKIIKDRPDIAFSLFPKDDKVFQLMSSSSADAKRLKLSKWMDKSLWGGLSPQSFSQGVQGKRMYGRLAFLAAENLPQISTYINNSLGELRGFVGNKAESQNGDAQIRILVVASAGGGTGSGTFVDVGYFLKHLIAQGNMTSVCSLEGVAAIAVSQDFSNREYTQNSLALMEELEYFSQASHVFEATYGDTDLDPKIGLQRPYDFPFLVSPMNHDTRMANNSKDALDQLKWKVADYLFLRTIDEGGTNGLGARMPDMITKFGETARLNGDRSGHFDGLGYPLTFMTLGVSLRQIPKELADRFDRRQTRADFVEYWIKDAQPGKEILIETVFKKMPDLQSSFVDDIEYLRGQLGLLDDSETSHNQRPEREVKNDNIAENLLYTDPQKKSIKDALEQDAARGDLDTAFKYLDGKPVEPHLPGYVAGTLAKNLAEMRLPDSPLKKRLSDRLWDTTIDLARGPRYTLAVIERVVGMIDVDLKLIEQAARTVADSSDSVAKILNIRLKSALLTAKKALLEEIRKELQGANSHVDSSRSLAERLKYLIKYVQAWKTEGDKGSKEETEIYERARIVMQPTVLDMPKRADAERFALLQRIDRTTIMPVIDWSRAEDFVADLPREAGNVGAIQYKSFLTLDSHMERLRANSAGMPTVLEQLEKDQHGIWADEASRQLNESRVMLTLDLAADHYGDALGNGQIPRAFKWFGLANSAQGQPDKDGITIFQRYQEAVNARFNAYRELTKGGQPHLDWEEGFQDTDLLALVSIRASFPTRIISHYHVDRNRPKLILDNEMPYTQVGIRRPIGQDQLKRAERCLLIGEIFARRPHQESRLPRITTGTDGATHVYVYRPMDKDVDERWEYSKGFGSAVGDLARNPDIIRALEADINTVIHGNGDISGDLKDEIIGHLEALQALGNQPGQGVGNYPRLDLWQVPFKEVQDEIQQWMTDQNWAVPDGMHKWAKLEDGEWLCANPAVPLCRNAYGPIKPTATRCVLCGYSG